MRASAPAKINLALVVGPVRQDGKHELLTVYQRIGMADRIDVVPAERTRVDGFADDTLVRDALELLAAHAAVDCHWRAKIEKHITSTAFRGTKTIKIALKKGLWKFYCSVHESIMHGSFRVR